MFLKHQTKLLACSLLTSLLVANAFAQLVPGEGSGGSDSTPPDAANPPLYQEQQPNPPVYNPPAYEPEPYNPPTYNPPTYNPPTYNPPTYNPPTYNPPTYNPPTYNPPQPVYQPTPNQNDYLVPGSGSGSSYDSVWSQPNPPDYPYNSGYPNFWDTPQYPTYPTYPDYPSYPSTPDVPTYPVTPSPQPGTGGVSIELNPKLYTSTVEVSQILKNKGQAKKIKLSQVKVLVGFYSQTKALQKKSADLFLSSLNLDGVNLALASSSPRVTEKQNKLLKEFNSYLVEYEIALELKTPTSIDFSKQNLSVYLLGSGEIRKIVVESRK